MSQDKKKTSSLGKWVDDKQSRGKYCFTREEALAESGLRVDTFRKAALRLVTDQRIARIRAGFYAIVPLEYKAQRVSPPDWFIADLMAFAQRLGWLLEQTEFADKASSLADWILQSNASPTVLQPALPKRGAPRDRRWNLWINTEVEGDLA